MKDKLELVIKTVPGYLFLDPTIIKIARNAYRIYFGVLSRPGKPLIIKSITGYLKWKQKF